MAKVRGGGAAGACRSCARSGARRRTDAGLAFACRVMTQRGAANASKSLSLEQLSGHFHQPINEVAREVRTQPRTQKARAAQRQLHRCRAATRRLTPHARLPRPQLGVCVTVLKQRCREFGIARWPFRKARQRLHRAAYA